MAEFRRKIRTTRRLVLDALSNDDFQRGIAALRTHGDAFDQNAAVTEEIDWFVFTRPE